QDLETVLIQSSPEPAPVDSPPEPVQTPEPHSQPAAATPKSVTPVAGVKLATPTPPSGMNTNAQRFEPTDLAAIKKELAAHVGPMARILVERAARKSTSLQQLYELLSVEIPEGPERKKFLAGRRR